MSWTPIVANEIIMQIEIWPFWIWLPAPHPPPPSLTPLI
jgi:hypothetical protein